MARPSLYTDALLDTIAERLSRGEPLAAICRDEGMPSDDTVRNWMEREDVGERVSRAIARAREAGEDWLAAECLQIADDGRNDYTMTADGDPVLDRENIQRSKLRIETRLKLLAKWNPRKWGDAVTLRGDKDNPVEVRRTARDLTDAELAAIAQGGLRAAD